MSSSGNLEGVAPKKHAKKAHRETIVVAGLPVNVFSDKDAAKAETPVVIMFLLHGRTGSARRMETYVHDIFEEIRARRSVHTGEKAAQDLIIVTIVSPSRSAWIVSEVYSGSSF